MALIGSSGKGSPTINRVAPTSSAALLAALNIYRKQIVFSNVGSVTVYLGFDNTVTSANGFPIPAGASFSDSSSSVAWWAVTASGTGDIGVIEVV